MRAFSDESYYYSPISCFPARIFEQEVTETTEKAPALCSLCFLLFMIPGFIWLRAKAASFNPKPEAQAWRALDARASGLRLTNAAFGRNRVLECGDLSPLWISFFNTEKKKAATSRRTAPKIRREETHNFPLPARAEAPCAGAGRR